MFVHGVYVTGVIWDDVVGLLGDSVRCIVPTWPLGAHDPLPDSVDLSVGAAVGRIVGLIDCLDLHDVTLVANDTGGGLVLAALGNTTLDIRRIGQLVLTNCDSYQHFPPRRFAPLVRLCRHFALGGRVALRALSRRFGRASFLRQVTCRRRAATRQRALFGAFVADATTRRQAVAVTATLTPEST